MHTADHESVGGRTNRSAIAAAYNNENQPDGIVRATKLCGPERIKIGLIPRNSIVNEN